MMMTGEQPVFPVNWVWPGMCFCQTGKMGFIRNLTQEEIIGQLIGINDYLASKSDKPVTNIVFMGMGEALSNFQNFRTSYRDHNA